MSDFGIDSSHVDSCNYFRTNQADFISEPQKLTQEEIRLQQDRERKAYWRRWGCYLSNRQWGTVREDYSVDGSAWDYFSFEQSQYRAYRWGEDGIAGISDNHQRLCFSLALWNERDPFLKERLFGLTNSQGNHGIDNDVYEDIASKFFEHFLYIVDAMNHLGSEGTDLWNEEDGFYYDVLHLPSGENIDLKVRSMVGLIPLFAVTTIEQETLEKLPEFKKRVEWFVNERPQLSRNLACMEGCDNNSRRLLAVVNEKRLTLLLQKMLDETEFLSDYGIRSVSKYHQEHPYIFKTDDETYEVAYEPAESPSKMFGGNSNWRGPIWFPVNYLLIESLQRFDFYYDGKFKVECPTGSGKMMNLWEVASELERRLISIFLPNESGYKPIYGDFTKFKTDPHWQSLLTFNEYFHGDNGAGLGALHQTGWTGLVAKLIMQTSKYGNQ